MGLLGHVDPPAESGGLSTGGQVHCVTEQTVAGHTTTDYARHDLTRVQPDSQLENDCVLINQNIIQCFFSRSNGVGLVSSCNDKPSVCTSKQ